MGGYCSLCQNGLRVRLDEMLEERGDLERHVEGLESEVEQLREKLRLSREAHSEEQAEWSETQCVIEEVREEVTSIRNTQSPLSKPRDAGFVDSSGSSSSSSDSSGKHSSSTEGQARVNGDVEVHTPSSSGGSVASAELALERAISAAEHQLALTREHSDMTVATYGSH